MSSLSEFGIDLMRASASSGGDGISIIRLCARRETHTLALVQREAQRPHGEVLKVFVHGIGHGHLTVGLALGETLVQVRMCAEDRGRSGGQVGASQRVRDLRERRVAVRGIHVAQPRGGLNRGLETEQAHGRATEADLQGAGNVGWNDVAVLFEMMGGYMYIYMSATRRVWMM